MSSDPQRSDDDSPSTGSGRSDADQRDPAPPEPEEQEERKPSATKQQKTNTKLSSKTTAKLSTSAKRIQKDLAEITLEPPPNCSAGLLSVPESITATSTVRESSAWTFLKTTGVLL
uniref:Ubiquitin conjugating enzyme E2 E3 n=1 Tax=Sus scrofa TaxID=9823 RepID=A0A8D0VPP3_PIG